MPIKYNIQAPNWVFLEICHKTTVGFAFCAIFFYVLVENFHFVRIEILWLEMEIYIDEFSVLLHF